MDDDSGLARQNRQRKAQGQVRGEGIHWLLPAADVSDIVELPKPVLPRGDLRDDFVGLVWCGAVPACAHAIEDRGRLGGFQGVPERAHVLGAQRRVARHLRGSVPACAQSVAVLEHRHDVGEQIDPALPVGVPRVDCPDLGEDLVGPVTPRGVRGEPQAVGQRDRVRGDLLGCVQVLLQQRSGHHQGVSGVGEALAGCAVGRERARQP